MNGVGFLLNGQASALAQQQGLGASQARGLLGHPQDTIEQAYINHALSARADELAKLPRKKAKMPIIMELQHEADEYLEDALNI